MKTENKNPFEPPERKSYKKRYLIRKAEEHEAEQEIESFDLEQEIEHDTNTTQRNSNSLG